MDIFEPCILTIVCYNAIIKGKQHQSQGKEGKDMTIIVCAHKNGHLICAECESGKEALNAARELISRGYELDGHQTIK